MPRLNTVLADVGTQLGLLFRIAGVVGQETIAETVLATSRDGDLVVRGPFYKALAKCQIFLRNEPYASEQQSVLAKRNSRALSISTGHKKARDVSFEQGAASLAKRADVDAVIPNVIAPNPRPLPPNLGPHAAMMRAQQSNSDGENSKAVVPAGPEK